MSQQHPADPTERSLDPHLHRYAQRAAGMTASEIRALFAVASRPEAVSLAGEMPYLPALPMESLAGDVAALVARECTAQVSHVPMDDDGPVPAACTTSWCG